jgi:glycosyltransferase involved in cell wall biosynthesis
MSLTKDRIVVLTSYPPRACGIATYAHDLVTALNRTYNAPFRFHVCAVENTRDTRNHPKEVTHTLYAADPADHDRIAREIGSDPTIRGIWVQHEFGLFNKDGGAHLIRLLRNVHKPVTITFHTVLPAPAPERYQEVIALAEQASDIIVLTERSAGILEAVYGVPREKISVIPYGTHPVRWRDKMRMKARYGLQDRLVLSTFGLLSSNKSIETALDALKVIKDQHPNVLYLVLGRTHPEVVRHEGEQYREQLQQKVQHEGLQDHVRFIDRYLELNELLEYLQLTDIYLFTSKDPEQAVSGTFAYAMGCGCPVISTRIPHAVEVLEEGTGVLIDFNDPGQLATATIELLGDASRMDRMGRNALHRMRATAWDNVAIAHARRIAQRADALVDLKFQWPEVTFQHLERLTDKMGLLQFCDISEPDPDSGHTLDDNARALVALCLHLANGHAPIKETDLMMRCLDYVRCCQRPDGRFLNYMDRWGMFAPQNQWENLDDSNGRALWALGVCVAHEHLLPSAMVRKAEHALWNCYGWAREVTSPRAMAFAIKGLHAYNSVRNSQRVRELIVVLAERLVDRYRASAKGTWTWFEPILTYGNAVLPEAMMLAYQETGRTTFRETALITFDFLLGFLFKEDVLHVISNRTWLKPDMEPEAFGEQPIDAAYTISALALFHEVTGDREYRRKMRLAFEWFLGRNHLSQVVYNRASGGCYDGLEQHSVNLNQGAESTVCYLLARAVMERERVKTAEQGASRPTVKARAPMFGTHPLTVMSGNSVVAVRR